MSIQYSPMAPVGGNDPAQYSYEEFLDLSKALREAQANVPLQVLNVVPTKPRTGMIVYADGTNWDPGAGAGVYGYINGGWVALHTGGAGSGANLSYTAATRVVASDTGTDATLPLVTSTEAGLAPLSGGGTTNFLRADATWAAPPAGATNLSYTASTRVVASDTGSDATLTLVTATEAGLAPLSGGGTANYLRADGTWNAPAAVVGDGDKGDISITGGIWNLDLTLDTIDAPVASVNFSNQQATSFRIENRTDDPVSPTTGQVWLRTNL